jgi:hypothetical protein
VKPKAGSSPEDRRLALEEETARIDEAERLARTLEDLRRDVAQLEQQRDALAALGDDRVEIAQKSYDPRYRVEIEWEPIRSRLAGNQLAAEVENAIVPLRQVLASTESRIAELLT